MSGQSKLILWAACATLLGLCSGYLFSSRFCTVSINRRVQKELALNQTMRELMAYDAALANLYIHTTLFNLPDATAVENQLHENHKKIAHIFSIYYDTQAAQQIEATLKEQTQLINALAQGLREGANLDALKKQGKINNEALAKILAQLNPEWQENQLGSLLDHYAYALMQELIMLQQKNWPQALGNNNDAFDAAMQLADELDQGITNQFPHKF